jgi:hypothetical protein
VIIAVLSRDLLISTRILDAADRVGLSAKRYDSPAALPLPQHVRLMLVDWAQREPEWGRQLHEWRSVADGPTRLQMILFGPHSDLTAHAEARAAGLGPMWARSKLMSELPRLMTAAG